MSRYRQIGLPGVTLEPADHICALYYTEREQQVMLPFLRTGPAGRGHVHLHHRLEPTVGRPGPATRFGGGIVVDLLKTHPKVLVGGMVIDNPHYLSPDEFLASRVPA